jgi:hypothetical protein
MGLEPTTLSITQLVGVSRAYRAIVYTAVLTRAFSHGLKKLLVAVHREYFVLFALLFFS